MKPNRLFIAITGIVFIGLLIFIAREGYTVLAASQSANTILDNATNLRGYPESQTAKKEDGTLVLEPAAKKKTTKESKKANSTEVKKN